MKKGLIIFGLLSCLSLNAIAADNGKYDRVKKETYSEYLERKSSISTNVTGKFSSGEGINKNTLTFSQSHIKCTSVSKIVSSDSGCDGTLSNCTEGGSAGDMEVDIYNDCMGTYAPFKDEQEGVGSCETKTIEWGQYGAGTTCSADIGGLTSSLNLDGKINEGESVMVQNQNTTDAFQGFAKVTCESGTIEILDSKCILVPDPCLAGDTIGEESRLDPRYMENENWRSSHLWSVTEPSWAAPDSPSYIVNGDPRNIDRSNEFKNKVSNGEREDYCYATLSPSNNGTLNTSFDVKSGDLIVNPEIDNQDAFFDKDNTNGVWRCFDGEFYNEGSSCQYKTQSCDQTTVQVPNGKGQFCDFNLPFQKHNAKFTSRTPTPENSIGHVQAFCWDGQWEIWEESCNLSCENDFSSENWNAEDGDPINCKHSAKSFSGRTAPTSVLTISNEDKLMDGSKSYKCDNGEWVASSQSCMPKSCSHLSANNWTSTTDANSTCSHKALAYSTPHNKIVSTSANNGSNATVGYISYQCRYGQFVDITDYVGDAAYEPTRKGFSPSDKNCTSTLGTVQCYFDLDQTEPSDTPSIFIDEGDGCYIECRVNALTGELNCTKSCTNTGTVNPAKNCFFAGGFSSCESEGWYEEGKEIHCPTWKLTPQICTGGSWAEKIIAAKDWSSKTVVAFSEILTKDGYLDNNVSPKVEVDFGKVYNVFTGTNQFGYGNSNSSTLDSAVESGSGAVACKSRNDNLYGESDTSSTCFSKAEQGSVKDWKLFFEGGVGCSMTGAASGEWTSSNIRVSCSSNLGANVSTSNVTYVVRYTDGLILTSPKISITAGINTPVVPAGYCNKIADVNNIAAGNTGNGCETTVLISNDIQATQVGNIRETRFVYQSGVCYEVEYTGNLTCEDNNPAPNYELLELSGSLSCVSNPVEAFNCGVSELPEWETEVSSIQGAISSDITLNLLQSANNGNAYISSGDFISTYTNDKTGCDTFGTNCTAKLKVVSGNEIQSWSVVTMPPLGSCTFKNNNNTFNITTGIWYTEGAELKCNFATLDSISTVIDFKLKDGTIVRSKSIALEAKN
jgi:hypothetical protein